MSVTLALLAGHMMADFPLQTDHMAANKHESEVVKGLHCSVHGAVTVFLVAVTTASLSAGLVAGVGAAVAHFVVDSLPRAEKKEDAEWFPLAVDQSIHVLSLWVVSGLL